MAKYEDILVLKDKVSESLEKINKNFAKTQAVSSKLQGKFARLQTSMSKFSNIAKNTTKILSGVAVAGGAVVGTTVAYANKIADVGDRVDKMSQKIGMSRKAFQEWDYIMSQNGGNVESLQMGFKTLTTQIANVQKGSKDSTKAFAQLGVSIKDNNGQLRSQDDIFNDTVRALQKIENPTQKAVLANKLFGRSATELRPLLNQEADAVDNLRKTANNLGLIISDKDIDNAVKYKDTMDTFTRFFQAKFATVAMSVMPQITAYLEKMINFANQNKEIFENMGVVIGWVFGTALPAVVKGVFAVVKAFNKVGEVIGTFIGTIISIPTIISTAITNAITNIIKFILSITEKIRGLGKIIQSLNPFADKKINIANRVGAGSQTNTTNNSTVNNNTTNTTNNNYYGNTYNNSGMGSFTPYRTALSF